MTETSPPGSVAATWLILSELKHNRFLISRSSCFLFSGKNPALVFIAHNAFYVQ
jgi:hypothetical protein